MTQWSYRFGSGCALVLLAYTSFASATDFFPQFYGDYQIKNWQCQATMKDRGCRDSAWLRIEGVNGITNITIFDAAGGALRTNELVEKKGTGAVYTLSGDARSAAFTAEAFDSKGTRYFYNVLEIRRSDEALTFTQQMESAMGSLSRIFSL